MTKQNTPKSFYARAYGMSAIILLACLLYSFNKVRLSPKTYSIHVKPTVSMDGYVDLRGLELKAVEGVRVTALRNTPDATKTLVVCLKSYSNEEVRYNMVEVTGKTLNNFEDCLLIFEITGF